MEIENVLIKIFDKINPKEYPICYFISCIITTLFAFKLYDKLDIYLFAIFGILIFIGFLSLSIFIQDKINIIKDKKYKKKINNNIIKRDIQSIKNIVNYSFTNELKKSIKEFLDLNKLDKNGLCNYVINLNNKEISKNDNIILNLKRYSYDLPNNIIYVNQKDNSNEFLIYINPVIVKMYNNNEFNQ